MPIDVDATWANAPDATSDPVYDAADLRRADSALVAGRGGANLGVRGGIVLHAATSLAVSVDGSDVVTVQPGAAVLPDDAVDGSGGYRSALPAAHSETLTARDATYSRIDLVVFRMLDVDVVGTHTSRTGRVEVIAGTASSAPVVPAKPSMSVELGRITVPASGGGAATVDSSYREYTCAAGGQLLAPSFAQLPVDSPPWQRALAMDTGREFVRKSGMWVPEVLSGTVTVPNPGTGAASSTITFAHPFDVAPWVTASCTSHTFYNVSPNAATTTQVNISVRNVVNTNADPVVVTWVAVRA